MFIDTVSDLFNCRGVRCQASKMEIFSQKAASYMIDRVLNVPLKFSMILPPGNYFLVDLPTSVSSLR